MPSGLSPFGQQSPTFTRCQAANVCTIIDGGHSSLLNESFTAVAIVRAGVALKRSLHYLAKIAQLLSTHLLHGVRVHCTTPEDDLRIKTSRDSRNNVSLDF